MADPRPLE